MSRSGLRTQARSRSIVCGSMPSPESNSASSVEVMRPNSVCQALAAAGLRSASMRSSGSVSVWRLKRRADSR